MSAGRPEPTSLFCQHCGKKIELDSVFCRFCGKPASVRPPETAQEAPPPDRPTHSRSIRRHAMWWVVAAVVVAIVAVFAIFTIPVPHSFGGSFALAGGQPGGEAFTFPSGSQVSGTWDTSNGAPVTSIEIVTQLGGIIYDSNNAVTGSFSFTATYSWYAFEGTGGPTTTDVQVSGAYSMPLV